MQNQQQILREKMQRHERLVCYALFCDGDTGIPVLLVVVVARLLFLFANALLMDRYFDSTRLEPET